MNRCQIILLILLLSCESKKQMDAVQTSTLNGDSTLNAQKDSTPGSDSLLISKFGIGPINISTKINEIDSSGYYLFEQGVDTDEAGEAYLWVRMDFNEKEGIGIEGDPITKKIFHITTNSPRFSTSKGIRVGDSFKKLISTYDNIEFVEEEGIDCYLRSENIIFGMTDLQFKNNFRYTNKELSKQKNLLLNNVFDADTKINAIQVLNYELPLE